MITFVPLPRNDETRRFVVRSASWCLALAAVCASLAPAAVTAAPPAFVDLRSQQTAFQSQGGRYSCIVFAATAALEAAYKHAGYGNLDLSEQFVNHLGKTFWLHPYWPQIVDRGPDGSETQVAAFSGGGGVPYIARLATGLKVPLDSLMPYHSAEYTSDDFPALANAWYSDYWNRQRNMSDFNLDERFLPLAALKADKYYSVRSYRKINPRSVSEIEVALASGREVVWDFNIANTGTADDQIWRPCGPAQAGCPGGGHAMLLVGYDRRSADPRNHHFIAKNSWDAVGAGADGFTRISYDYLRYGNDAAYILSVNAPQSWPELAFVGRWNLDFDGFKGVLDIYHLPGQSVTDWAYFGVSGTDLRLGTFYDATGTAFRVNGHVAGQSIRFYIDGANPNAKWDEIGGREFSYTMVQSPWGEIMAGVHKDGDGRTYGGYAKKLGPLSSGTPAPRPLRARSYMGADWKATFDGTQGTFRFLLEDNSFLSDTERPRFTGLTGWFIRDGSAFRAQALVSNADPNTIRIRVPAVLGEPLIGGEIHGKFLNWELGVVAGNASSTSGSSTGFVMIRQ